MRVQFSFLTKAKTLAQLHHKIAGAEVLPVFVFKVGDYLTSSEGVLNSIQQHFSDELLVVRSSSQREDNSDFSNAGHFDSVLNVTRKDRIKLKSAIERVINSLDNGANKEDEVFIQPQLADIKIAGVAFTSDLNTLAPYYVVNYDTTGSSDAVTSGAGHQLKTFICFKQNKLSSGNDHMDRLISVLKQLENGFNYPHLDVEFAFNKNNDLFIFQVRKLSTFGKEDLSVVNLQDALLKLHKKITKLSSPHPNLLGEQAIYGVMPDWNPAEIIGLKPKYFATSLYKELITDSIWAYQRDNYGYRNLRSHPLMVTFMGVPYIDVRVDFNSFIPKELNDTIAQKLINFYLTKLNNFPVLHDKVEFEIVHSCYYFNLPSRLENDLANNGFSTNEIHDIQNALLELTNAVINPVNGLYLKDLAKAQILDEKYSTVIDSKLSVVDKIYWLIEDCKRYGTLPFAGIARSAFIATQFLRSFVEVGIFSEADLENYNASLSTVAKELNLDLNDLHNGQLSKQAFLEKYGHLRPGTYDIHSNRYDSNFEKFFSGKISATTDTKPYLFNARQVELLSDLISKNKLQTTPEELLIFIKAAIEGREKVKFMFTRSLSKAMQMIEALALKYGVAYEDIVYLDIKTILDLYASLDHRDVKEIFERDIEKNKKTYSYTKAVRLPSLITHPDNVYHFFLDDEEPNYITLKNVTANVIKEDDLEQVSPEGKIVFIKSADPGYDYLFTKGIAGLITQFGGANSHMAVRCAELGIPAVIGAGEANYNNWNKASHLEIDALNKAVRVIS